MFSKVHVQYCAVRGQLRGQGAQAAGAVAKARPQGLLHSDGDPGHHQPLAGREDEERAARGAEAGGQAEDRLHDRQRL